MSRGDAQQLAVALSREPATIALACPGSGKTRTLVLTAREWIRRGVDPRRLLVLTFTRRAAAELRERIAAELGPAADGMTVATFHSVCYGLLRRHHRIMGYRDAGILILDGVEQDRVLRDIIALAGRKIGIRGAKAALERLGTTGCMPVDDATEYALVRTYRATLKAENAVDYSILLAEILELFHRYPEVLAEVQAWYTHLIVDEFQDTDSLQFHLYQTLATGAITVVGDIDQLIYSWRGSDAAIVDRFCDRYKVVPKFITTNYRSSGPVIALAEAARKLMRRQSRDTPMRPPGEPRPGKAELVNEYALPELIQSYSVMGSVAVLARTNRRLMSWSLILDEARVEHRMLARQERMYDRDDVKAVLAYLAWPEMKQSGFLMDRVVACEGGGSLTRDRWKAEAAASGRTLFDLVLLNNEQLRAFYALLAERPEGRRADSLLPERLVYCLARVAGLRGRLDREAQEYLTGMLGRYLVTTDVEARTASGFILWMATRDAQDDLDKSSPVQLMTVHAAKGLEFDTVVIVGLEEGEFPHGDCARLRDDRAIDELEEERRLFYVAVTRARTNVFCGKPPVNPGLFLRELWPDLGAPHA